MSGLISIVLWIIIMAFVSGVLKGRSNGNGKNQNPYNKNGTTPVPPASPTSAQPFPGQPGRGTSPAGTGSAKPAVTNYTAGMVPEKSRHAASKSVNRASSSENGGEAGMSTTDYLRQKAVLDEANHRQEKQQENQRARWETGGLPAAKRLFEGDNVPQGMRRVSCSYCGADNLLPQGSGQKYTCYFCREELE